MIDFRLRADLEAHSSWGIVQPGMSQITRIITMGERLQPWRYHSNYLETQGICLKTGQRHGE